MGSVLGIDLSTQSCTVEVRDRDTFDVLGRRSSPLPWTNPPVSEQEAHTWWQALVLATGALERDGVDLSQVEALSVAGQCHGLVALDAEGNTLLPVKLWNDTTSAPYIARLVERIGAHQWIRRVGSRPTAAFTVAKLARLVEEEPEVLGRVRHILLPHDWVNMRLTGEFVTDRSEASGTGYFDSTRNTYDWDLLERSFGQVLDWPAVLPEVRGPGAQAGLLRADAALALGLKAGIPVAIGGGDQHMAALGLGINEGDAVFSLGTSGVVLTSSATPVHDLSGRVDGVANVTGGWLPLVCTLNCTKVTDWAARILGVDIPELDRLAHLGRKAGTGLFFAAYLDGERSPALPHATGVLSGLTGATGREEFAAAAFEGVLMGMMSGLSAIEDCGIDVSGRVIAVGGGSRSRVYTRGIADMTGRPVHVLEEPEATVRGACLQALALIDGADLGECAALNRPPTARLVEPEVSSPQWPEVRETYLATAGFAASTCRRTSPDLSIPRR